jgi:hypothetical protein
MNLARQLRLGSVLYHTYHAPKGFLTRCQREGPINLLLSHRGRRAMERAVSDLKPLSLPVGDVVGEIHFLTGRKFWYQTCFCAYSMLHHSGIPLRPVVYDDGTLEEKHRLEMARILPQVRFVPREETEARVDDALPWSLYPVLRARRLAFPLLRKLTDIHAGSTGWKLFLDSDMLFFQRPAFLMKWLESPSRPCYMLDCVTSYGYTPTLMTSLAGAVIPEKVNTGICGLQSESLDWDRMESWCEAMLRREGTHYLQEQALSAMFLAGRECSIAPASDYVVNPPKEDVVNLRGVMHHYVAVSKAWYFRFGWKDVLRSVGKPQ